MIKKLLLGAGMAWLYRKFVSGGSRTSGNYGRSGRGSARL